MAKVILHSGKSISSFVCASILKEFKSFEQILICNYENAPLDHYILLNAVSYKIVSDLWNGIDDFLQGHGTPLTKHSVINDKGEIRTIDFQQTYVINYALLLDKLFSSLFNNKSISFQDSRLLEIYENDIEINSISNPHCAISFGQRQLIHVEVSTDDYLGNESFFEITESSWFYLAPFSNKKSILQIAIPSIPDNLEEAFLSLVSETRKIRLMYKSYDKNSIKAIPISPLFRIPNETIALLTGSTLMKFDPVSGYGLLNTMRSAILGSASLKLIKTTIDYEGEIMAHYMKRNILSMRDHINSCIDLYSSLNALKWAREVELMTCGLSALDRVDNNYKHNRQFHLDGFNLE